MSALPERKMTADGYLAVERAPETRRSGVGDRL